jgi:hypothetical protein
MPSVCARLPLFVPAAAVPAAHTRALALALGSCVPALRVSLLFVAPYL